jgi:hypothetical protein
MILAVLEVPRSSLRALSFIREKKLSIDSTPTRVDGARLARTCLKILADLRFKLTFEFFIRFELHTIHTSKIVPVIERGRSIADRDVGRTLEPSQT